MPNTASAKKRLRQNIDRRERNRAARSAIKTQVKKVRATALTNPAQAEMELREAAKQLDRAGARGVIHRNAAARTKSRLQHLVKKAKTATPAKTTR